MTERREPRQLPKAVLPVHSPGKRSSKELLGTPIPDKFSPKEIGKLFSKGSADRGDADPQQHTERVGPSSHLPIGARPIKNP